MGIPVALILEDDAYPLEKIDLDKVISEVPDDWEIIKLHCDGRCKNGSNEAQTSGASAAAYLINTRGLEKMKNLKLSTHIDHQQKTTITMYKSKVNLFWTDEKSSTNRKGDNYLVAPFLDFLFPSTSGEKTYNNFLGYKLFRIPFTNIELTNYQVKLILILIPILVFLIFKIRER